MRERNSYIVILLVLVGTFYYSVQTLGIQQKGKKTMASVDTATFAAGCFWCVEAVFQNLKGVQSIISGYSGGFVPNPTYKQVCSDTTGHAEACQIVFDPKIVSYDELLEVFWKVHDPTTMNRQGNDEGTQYRSSVFYHNDEQKKLAEHYKKELDASGAFNAPIVTEIVPFKTFYKRIPKHCDVMEADSISRARLFY